MDQAQANPAPEASISDRLSAYLAAEVPADNKAPQEAQEPADNAPVEAADDAEYVDAQVEDSEPVEAEDDPTEEIKWNGEVKRLTKAELRELAQKGFDYTQKTTSLAEEKRAFEAERQRQQAVFQANAQQLETIAELKAIDSKLAQFEGVNWLELADSDPVQYLKLKEVQTGLQQAKQSKLGEAQQRAQQLAKAQEQQQGEYLARESERLANAIPEFRGEKAAEAKKRVASYLEKQGWTAQEIGSIADHRAVALAYKAMQFDALQTQKTESLKAAKNLPPVVKPGVATSGKQQASQKFNEQRQQLRKTGKVPPGLLSRFL